MGGLVFSVEAFAKEKASRSFPLIETASAWGRRGTEKDFRKKQKNLDDLTTMTYNNRLPCECNLIGKCHSIVNFQRQ